MSEGRIVNIGLRPPSKNGNTPYPTAVSTNFRSHHQRAWVPSFDFNAIHHYLRFMRQCPAVKWSGKVYFSILRMSEELCWSTWSNTISLIAFCIIILYLHVCAFCNTPIIQSMYKCDHRISHKCAKKRLSFSVKTMKKILWKRSANFSDY